MAKRWGGAAEAALLVMASDQYGVLGRDQILAAGMSKRTLRRRLAARTWTELYPGVYRVLNVAQNWRQQLMGALLWGGEGAVVSHGSAAVLWGLEKEEDAPIEIITPKKNHGHKRVDVRFFRRAIDPKRDVERREGFPVTSRLRTLLDLATQRSEDQLDAAIDQFAREKDVKDVQLRRFLERTEGKGVRGVARLRRVYRIRVGELCKDSELERRFFKDVIEKYGLPQPVHNWPVTINGRKYKIDAAWPDLGLCIDLHGKRDHLGRKAIQDTRRTNDLVQAGLKPYVFWWDDVVHCPEETARKVGELLDQASWANAA